MSDDTAIDAMKRRLNPTLYLLHPKILSNLPLVQVILTSAHGAEVPYLSMKSSSWNVANSFNLLSTKVSLRHEVSASLESRNPTTSGSSNYLRFAALIDLEDKTIMTALSPLLLHLQATVFNMSEGKLIFASMRRLDTGKLLRMDSTTISALQIFQDDYHPNIFKGPGKNKEGFSLFMLFDRTFSVSGRQRLREWMKSPFGDIKQIISRQNGIELVVRPSNSDFIAETSKLLRKVHDITSSVLKIKKCMSTHAEWCRLFHSLSAGLQIARLASQFVQDDSKQIEDVQYLRELFRELPTGELFTVFGYLDSAIDINASLSETTESDLFATGSIHIREGYDDLLDSMRETYAKLDDILQDAATLTLQDLQLLENLSVQFVPQVGYFVIVHQDDEHIIRTRPEFVFSYKQDGFLCFKSPLTRELDMNIGDIRAEISDRQKTLMIELEDKVLASEEGLHLLSYIIESLDAIISLGTIAIELNFKRPVMTEEDVIIIKGGRHILQEMVVETFVPNDTFVTSEKNIALITGANGSGKSVYIKQVGLLVYLAHLGSWLPAEKAIIGLTDWIFARIATVETVSCPQSAFASDLTQISRMLQSHTRRSLCLIDEFGKGTSPIDGISLLATTIRHFINYKAKVLCVLHFTEIFDDRILELNDSTTAASRSITQFCMQMYSSDANIEDSDADPARESLPLYKLGLGVSPSSEGIPCAKAAGINEKILARAIEVKLAVSERRELQPIGAVSDAHTMLTPLHIQGLRLLMSNRDWMSATAFELDDLKKCFQQAFD